MMKETDKQIIKRLKEENKVLYGKTVDFSRKIYAIELSIWEHGTGSNQVIALCRNLTEATVIKAGLETIYPSGFSSECGSEKIKRSVRINIRASYIHDVKNFVKKSGW